MNYLERIAALPLKEKYKKDQLLTMDFELYHDDKMCIYYAPHNEYVNIEAEIVIVGITPGWTQTEIAYRTAKHMLDKGRDIDSVYKKCKYEARFAGSMRTNLIQMLDELDMGEVWKLDTCKKIFDEECALLHTTSLIRYPVFVNGKNYSGSSPKILETEILLNFVKTLFIPEIQQMKKKFMIVPLGKAVEDVLRFLVSQDVLCNEQCLFGFPHPSGANAHRLSQFKSNKLALKNNIVYYFR